MTIKIYLETYGCTLNFSDSELMAGLLVESGFRIVDNPKDAAIIIINTCTVKTPTENKFFRRLEEFIKLNKPLVIAGCIPQTDPNKLQSVLSEYICPYSLIGTYQLTSIAEVVQRTLEGDNMVLIAKERQGRLNLPKRRKNDLIEIVPISRGCLGECSYCLTKFARGDLVSYDPIDIVKQIKNAIGIKEVWLTSQDTGAYGKDIGIDLIMLLKSILSIDKEFLLRLGMANPDHIIEIIDPLIELYKHPKMFKFVHLPVQSGNDDVLTRMKRKYRILGFREIIRKLRENIPQITLSTDIICGFPGETEEQFEDSMELIKEIRPDVLNISRYWERPNTSAVEIEDKVPGSVSKDRSRKMTRLFENISLMRNETWIDWEGKVLVDQINPDGTLTARNHSYKPIILRADKDILGKLVNVKIKNARTYHLIGRII